MSYNLDVKQIAHKLEFDLEDVELLVDVFLETSFESLSVLKEAIDSKNFDSIFTAAHSIKGSASNLTLDEISSLAKEIEFEAKSHNDIDYIEKYNILYSMIDNIKRQ